MRVSFKMTQRSGTVTSDPEVTHTVTCIGITSPPRLDRHRGPWRVRKGDRLGCRVRLYPNPDATARTLVPLLRTPCDSTGGGRDAARTEERSDGDSRDTA